MMKRRICAADEFAPHISDEFAKEYLYNIIDELRQSLVTRYPNVTIRVVSFYSNATSISALIDILDAGRFSQCCEFQFQSYLEYFDELDFQQHLDRTQIKFIDSILH